MGAVAVAAAAAALAAAAAAESAESALSPGACAQDAELAAWSLGVKSGRQRCAKVWNLACKDAQIVLRPPASQVTSSMRLCH
eukprot:117132-Chlamydomonas_euryale.AAC.7